MKIALDWIAEYLSPVPSAAQAAEALMNGGLPIESTVEAAGVKGPTQVLDVEVTSNRTDCFSHVGLARELSALCGGNFAPPKITLAESATPASSAAAIDIRDAAGCPYYSARIIRNVKVGPSPDWLQKRLLSIGLRPVNNVVDVTNFVLMELGQPLHAFDFDKLEGRRIVVRRAAANERLTAIDGREYKLEPSMLLIADAANPVAIAGVMGGKATEVTEATTNILLESARFEPLTIRTTSRALALKSDSSYRFERGIDPTMADTASRRAAQWILQTAGGELLQGSVAAGAAAWHAPQVSLRFKRFQEIVGIPIAEERALSILSALGFAPAINENKAGDEDDALIARVPSFRLDVEREIDLIEEIARVHGYEHIPTLDRVTHAVTPESTREKAARALRQTLVEAGFSEAVTVTFIARAEADVFAKAFNGEPIRPRHGAWADDVLRPSLLPSLLAARRTNQYAGTTDARLFETAAIFLQQGDAQSPPLERRMLSAVAGDVMRLVALARLVASRLHPDARIDVVPTSFPFYAPGTSGEVRLTWPGGAAGIGNVGQFTTDVQKRYDLREKAAGLELDLEALLAIFQPVRRAKALPRFPAISRDLSIVVEEAIRWADVKAAIADAKPAALETVAFVTTFRNNQIGQGKKSLTLTLVFRDAARTLTSEEIDTQVKRVIDLLAAKFSAALRV